MDAIRTCYQSDMRLWSDSPETLTPGRWQWCPPGAAIVPYAHPWGSSSWDSTGDRHDDECLGETGRGAYSTGVPSPILTGQHWCGDAEDWSGQVLLADATETEMSGDIPTCCEDLMLIREFDGTPSVQAHTLWLNQDAGLTLVVPSAGLAQLSIAPASPSQSGILTDSTQILPGGKHFLSTRLDVWQEFSDFPTMVDGAVVLAQSDARISYIGVRSWSAEDSGHLRLHLRIIDHEQRWEMTHGPDSNGMSYTQTDASEPTMTLAYGITTVEGLSGTVGGLTFVAGWCVGGDDEVSLDRLATGTLPTGVDLTGGTW